MKRAFTSLVLGLALLVGGGGVGLAQDNRTAFGAYNRGDYQTAFRQFSVLAAQGSAQAQYMLGFMYADGEGVTQDYREAVRWYRLSAEQGYGLAQFNLGLMYGLGQGVTQDFVYSHMWFNIAAATSSGADAAEAANLRDKTAAKKMTAAQIARAQELARLCVAKNYKGC